MKLLLRHVARLAGTVLAATCALSVAAWAGGAGFGDDDDNSEEEGPSYFGFVRDSGGATIPDAKVTVGVKNRGGVVTRTDALGTYKVPGVRQGHRSQGRRSRLRQARLPALRVVRRSAPSADPKSRFETECTLARI